MERISDVFEFLNMVETYKKLFGYEKKAMQELQVIYESLEQQVAKERGYPLKRLPVDVLLCSGSSKLFRQMRQWFRSATSGKKIRAVTKN